MAKKSLIERNNKRIRLVKKFRNKREELKKIVKRAKTLNEKLSAQHRLSKMSRNSSYIRVRNMCFETGRTKGYIGYFGVSRIVFRELALFGLLPGVKKASW